MTAKEGPKANLGELLVVIGERIKRIRLASGRSQKEVAAAAGVSPAYIYLVEKGEQNLTITNFSRLAAALGVSVDELLVGTEGEVAPSQRSIGHLAGLLQKLADLVESRREAEARVFKTMMDLLQERQERDEALIREMGRLTESYRGFVRHFAPGKAEGAKRRKRE